MMKTRLLSIDKSKKTSAKFTPFFYPQGGSQGWNSDALKNAKDWIVSIPEPLVSSLTLISTWMQDCRYQWNDPALEDFQFKGLPLFAKLIRESLRRQQGIVLLSGLDLQSHGEDAARLFLLKLGQCLGTVSSKRGMLYDVTDRGLDYRKDNILVSGTRDSPGFHTDSTDRDYNPGIVGLMCLRQAKSGGENRLVSALAAYQHLKDYHPEVLRRLSQNFIRDKIVVGEINPRSIQERRQHQFPIFEWKRWYNGLSFRYMRYWIESGYEKAELTLRAEDRAALDTLDRVLNRDELVYQFRLEPGQILLINNHTVAHDRTLYEDWEDPAQKRLLVRLWVENDALTTLERSTQKTRITSASRSGRTLTASSLQQP